VLTADTAAAQDPPGDEASRRLSWLFAVPVALFVLVDLGTASTTRDFVWASQQLTATRTLLLVGVATVSAVAVLFAARTGRLGLNLPIAAFVSWAGVASILGIHPARSAVAWLVLTGAACAGTAAVRQAGDRAALTTIWLAAAGLAVGSVFLDVTGMIERINGRLAGPTLDANVLAHICGLGVVALGLTIRRSTFYRLVCALPLLYVVYESETRTILVALAVAAGTAVLGRAPRTLFIGALVIAPLVIAFDFASSLETAVQRSSDEDLLNLSGRIGVWEFSFDRIMVDPFTGFGLASGPQEFGEHSAASGVQIFSQSSHSLPLEIARETGVVGLGLAAIAAARGLARRRWSLLPLTAYLVVSALTMPLSGFAGLVTVAWFVVITPPTRLDTRAQDVA
jgi:hypothetical protein